MSKETELVEGYYATLYYKMLNAATNAIWTIEDGKVEKAKEMLISAQQKCEEIYISKGEDETEINKNEAEEKTEKQQRKS